MIHDHFGLNADPFMLSPDLRYKFMSRALEETMAHLAYGLEQGEDIILITGGIGTGKTLALHNLLDQLSPRFHSVCINVTQLDFRELLKLILSELGVAYRSEADTADLLVPLKNALLEKRQNGNKLLLIIDEGQNLAASTLEGVRLLGNLAQPGGQCLQVVLAGQLGLEKKVNQPELAQLRQRIRVHYRLETMDRDEVREYVRHRLHVAGRSEPLFKPKAIDRISGASGGVPRLVNIICSRALLSAFVDDSRWVDEKHIDLQDLPPVLGPEAEISDLGPDLVARDPAVSSPPPETEVPPVHITKPPSEKTSSAISQPETVPEAKPAPAPIPEPVSKPAPARESVPAQEPRPEIKPEIKPEPAHEPASISLEELLAEAPAPPTNPLKTTGQKAESGAVAESESSSKTKARPAAAQPVQPKPPPAPKPKATAKPRDKRLSSVTTTRGPQIKPREHQEVLPPRRSRTSARPFFVISAILVAVCGLVYAYIQWGDTVLSRLGLSGTSAQSTPADHASGPEQIFSDSGADIPADTTLTVSDAPTDQATDGGDLQTGSPGELTASRSATPSAQTTTAEPAGEQVRARPVTPPPALGGGGEDRSVTSAAGETVSRAAERAAQVQQDDAETVAERSVPTTTTTRPATESAAITRPSPRPSTPRSTQPSAPSAPMYAVHCGSFRDGDRAFELCDRLRERGMLPFYRKLSSDGTVWYRVFVGPFRDMVVAERELRRVRQTGIVNDSRIVNL